MIITSAAHNGTDPHEEPEPVRPDTSCAQPESFNAALKNEADQ
jgi:hypothetical protein